jgi:hypothetical protein
LRSRWWRFSGGFCERGAAVKGYLVPFVVAFAICALVFLGLDFSIMKMMGLTLIYQP